MKIYIPDFGWYVRLRVRILELDFFFEVWHIRITNKTIWEGRSVVSEKKHLALFVKLLVLLGAVVMLGVPSVWAQTLPGKQTNGCGPEGWGWIVPDRTLLSNCEFKDACDKHDICHRKCLRGGEYFGQVKCSNPESKEQRRKKCDENLKNEINKDNSHRSICGVYASIYAFAVSTGGKGFFDGQEVEDFLKFLDNNPGKYDLEKWKKRFYDFADSKKQGYRFKFDVKNSEPDLSVYNSSESFQFENRRVTNLENYNNDMSDWGNNPADLMIDLRGLEDLKSEGLIQKQGHINRGGFR